MAIATSLALTVLAAAPCVFLALLFVRAPYGRHHRGGFGPTLSTRLAWVFMESPTVFWFVAVYAIGPQRAQPASLILLALWLVHYGHRTLIYPLRLRPSAKQTPWIVVGFGFVFQVVNSSSNALQISTSDAYTWHWVLDIRFVLGTALFGVGFVVNRWADAKLRRLRADGSQYAIPHGGLYEVIACPNYFGELLIWTGWAIASWSLPGLAFAVFTAANLVPRARSHLSWYRQKFPDFPLKRRALIPFLF